MHAPWLYCPDLHCGPATLDETEGRHALASLRLRPGDAVTLFDGCGHVARATLLAGETGAARPAHRRARQSTVRVDVIETVSPPAHALTLIVPGCKGDRLDWLVEKCTELGVTRLLFTEFERSVVHVPNTRVEKLRRAAIEACKQCRRAWLPSIRVLATLTDAQAAVGAARVLVAHPADDAAPLGPWLTDHLSTVPELAVVIGPEGGLSDSEVDLLRSASGQLVRLAEHILRVETAAVAVAAAWASAAIALR